MEFEQIRENFRNLNPEHSQLYGLVYVANREHYWIPSLTRQQTVKLQTARQFLKEKGLSGKKIGSQILCEVDALLQRVKEQKIVLNFIPFSGWLETGEQHLAGYSSFLVGEGAERIVPVDIPSPGLDEIEQLLIPAERAIFRSILSRAVRALYEVKPVVSPVVVFVGANDMNTQLLSSLVSLVLGGTQELMNLKTPMLPRFVHCNVSRSKFSGDRRGGLDCAVLGEFVRTTDFWMQEEKNCFFSIPNFVFVTVTADFSASCLAAISHPRYLNNAAIFSVGDSSKSLPSSKTIELELPGYLYRLLAEPADGQFNGIYFASDIQERKFLRSPEYRVYQFFYSIYHGKNEAKTISELDQDLSQMGPRQLVSYASRQTLDDILHIVSLYRPTEIRHLKGQEWQFNFSSF